MSEILNILGKDYEVKHDFYRDSSTGVNHNTDMVRVSIFMPKIEYMQFQDALDKVNRMKESYDDKQRKQKALELLQSALNLLKQV